MTAAERDLLRRLLKQSILTLCRETVSYRCRLEVDGIVCLTADESTEHVVKIHEVFDRQSSGFDGNHERKEKPAIASLARNSDREKKDAELHGSTRRKLDDDEESVTGVSLLPKAKRSVYYGFESNGGLTEDDDSTRQNVACSPTPTPPPTDGVAIDLTVVKQESMDYSPMPNKEDIIQEHASPRTLTLNDYKKMGLDGVALSSATDIICKKCDAVLDTASQFEEHNMSKHAYFTCLVCLTTFTSRNNMKRHIRLHSGIKPYSCHSCSESFARNDDYKRHLLKHTFQKPFRCAVCKTGYSDRACVKSHMIQEHKASVFHICPQCGETFVDLHRFQRHKETHPEFQDYRCSVCSFTGSNALMYHKHMLTHGPTKEYSCKHCNLTFSDPFTYTGHLKQHKGDDNVQHYHCCFCDVSLTSFEQFHRHEHTHIQPKQHVCQDCNKVFRYPSNLREHMITHLSKAELLGQPENGDTHKPSSDQLREKWTSQISYLLQNSRSETGSMNTEENNKRIDMEIVAEGSDIEAITGDDINGSSDYWCGECNHGFGTEHELQTHIMTKHEVEDGCEDHQRDRNVTVSSIEQSQHDSDSEASLTESTAPQAQSSPFIQLTRIPEPNTNFMMYQSALKALGDFTSSKELQNTVLGKYTIHVDKIGTTDVQRGPRKIPFSSQGIDLIQERKHDEAYPLKHAKKSDFEYHYICTGLPSTVQDLNEENRIEDNTQESHPSQQERAKSVPIFNILKPPDNLFPETLKLKVKRPQTNFEDSALVKTESMDQENSTNGNVSQNGDHSACPKSTPTTSESRSTSPGKTATTINLKTRNPGFERVVTPHVLFKTKAPFTCELCDETFANFESFHDHGARIHRRYICSYCGKVFTSRPNRERHIRYHTGDRPYKCELCDMSFLRGDDLKYHRTTKHADVKPFVCAMCQTSFSLPKELEKHLRLNPDHKV